MHEDYRRRALTTHNNLYHCAQVTLMIKHPVGSSV